MNVQSKSDGVPRGAVYHAAHATVLGALTLLIVVLCHSPSRCAAGYGTTSLSTDTALYSPVAWICLPAMSTVIERQDSPCPSISSHTDRRACAAIIRHNRETRVVGYGGLHGP